MTILKTCIRRRQSGAFAIMFAPLLMVLLGFFGLALDLGQVINRKTELQGLAQGVALAAARELNGTSAGVGNAVAKAGEAARRSRFGYWRAVAWRDEALRFSSTPGVNAEWVGADAARGAPANRYYVKVDTRDLEPAVGAVATVFMRVLGQAYASVAVGESAIAGRSTIHITPLAVCAMSPQAGATRNNPGPPASAELVEYGFRRGVGYDLMQLNPGAATPTSFVIDPLAPPGGLGDAANAAAAAVAPFVCSGRMWTARVTGGAIRVGSPFPIGALYRELNSRFDQYTDSRCKPAGAPPDFNINSYSPGPLAPTLGASWMHPRPSGAGAAPTTTGARLHTIADLPAPPGGTPPGAYGPLWAYSRAVKAAGYVAGAPEPANGYATFAPADWPGLYPAAPAPATVGYPSTDQPYHATSGTHYNAPSLANRAISVVGRRVLHVPLLACPVPAGQNVGATALAIGKFFMTVPASSTTLHAEFAGTIPEHTLTGHVTLYP